MSANNINHYDAVVIGAGPGGYVAAIALAQLGKKTALIEEEHLGGVCLNWGCIPTKALLKSAELYYKINSASQYGIDVQGVKLNLKQMVDRSKQVSEKLVSGIRSLINKNKITLINGRATLKGAKIINIINIKEQKDGQKNIDITAKNIILATGAKARILSGYEPDGNRIWYYKEALRPPKLPKSMIVVGSGAIGVEFASFYQTLGTEVTVLEAAERILPGEDEEISLLARKAFEAKGIKFHTGIKLNGRQIGNNLGNNSVQVTFDVAGKQHLVEAEILLMAVGTEANIKNIGLENTAIKLEKGRIVTNDLMQTDEEGIYAIGDVVKGPWLAHKASHEGIIAAQVIAGKNPHPLIKNNIPSCIYSFPQIASIGLTENEARLAGHQINVGRFPFYANGKALIIGENNGLIKTVFDSSTGELLGAHMIGAEVSELIHGYGVAKTMEGTELDLINTVFPHPTLSEMLHESVLQAYNKQIHI